MKTKIGSDEEDEIKKSKVCEDGVMPMSVCWYKDQIKENQSKTTLVFVWNDIMAKILEIRCP